MLPVEQDSTTAVSITYAIITSITYANIKNQKNKAS